MKLILFAFSLFAAALQAQQINLPRVEQMPNLPQPYAMRNWKQVARDYDNLVFDTSLAGAHLPLTAVNPGAGVNYPEVHNLRMDTYVGQRDHGKVAEAINLLPAVVGASLVGVDKRNHLGANWVAPLKDFYNRRNHQRVYLNNYSSGTGGDWWYETMPNVFFYQLLSLYPEGDGDFAAQFTAIADRQLEVVFALGGDTALWRAPNMNYRAFNLLTGRPTATGVPEPEAAGAIAWMLYQAYLATNNLRYRQGAELALEFLNSWARNPSYEIQLPYGIVAAARLNAVEGTNFNLDKLLRWAFSSGSGTLRDWGCIVGSWGGYPVSGLIGEANDRGNDYAFLMNGFQHAAALAPVAKYDKRYARALGKWLLNLSAASRYFYRNGLPAENQHAASHAWSQQFDPAACIPYESMKQSWNSVSPFAMGDAVGGDWAATNLSLYSGSSVGYLAAIVDTTNAQGVLQIDLNKTDFRGSNLYPAYLYYNPHLAPRDIILPLPAGSTWDVYDAISETTIATNASSSITFAIGADSVRLLVIYPAGSTLITAGRHLRVQGGAVIDYHHGYNYTTSVKPAPRPVHRAQVYPNPARRSAFTLALPAHEQISRVEILNTAGQCLWAQSFPLAPSHTQQLHPPLRPGLYLLKASSKTGQVYVGRVVVGR